MINLDSTRTLWVLRGDVTKLFSQLSDIIKQHKGDWITISDQAILSNYVPNIVSISNTKTLLGQEYLHAIFDATQSFNLEAFAMLSGTLVKGSRLILLLPKNYNLWADKDSLRWNENAYPIPVPNFINHLQHTISKFNGFQKNNFSECYLTSPDYDEQQHTLKQVLNSDKPIHVITAKRGRGKSALAGQFSHYRHCIVTAPNKKSLTTFFRFAKPDVRFYAPDELIEKGVDDFAGYLIIDEAAMIPLPMLKKLLQLVNLDKSRILLTTTVEGYEGTGQGFLLKLLNDKQCDYFYLEKPIRWNGDDQLEYFTDCLVLNGLISAENQRINNTKPIDYSIVARHDLSSLKEIFYLLKTAHYQTTLVDLRRLLDATNLTIWQAKQSHNLIGAAITVKEGDLPDDLIEEIWKGNRRPKGNMVAQSLVAHAGVKQAAKLKSVRINRIAVIASYRRQNIATQLIQHTYEAAKKQHQDFLSVSFAYSRENYQFWSSVGFVLVHVGSRLEASSGTYSVMAIKPINQNGINLVNVLSKKLQRNMMWLKEIIALPFDEMLIADTDQQLTKQDIMELYGFCYFHRAFEATYASLCRLQQFNDKQNNRVKLSVLGALLKNKNQGNAIIQQFQLTGRKALLETIKQEVKQWLNSNNEVIYEK